MEMKELRQNDTEKNSKKRTNTFFEDVELHARHIQAQNTQEIRRSHFRHLSQCPKLTFSLSDQAQVQSI